MLVEDRQIFIIHSEDDTTILRLFINEFHDQTYSQEGIISKLQIKYLDSRSPAYLGRDFGEAIINLIEDSDKIIIIISESIFKSIWVNQEIGYTIKAKEEGDYFCMIDRRFVGRGFGFIHSNIDAQVFDYGDVDFFKIDAYFQREYGEKTELGEPLIVSRSEPREVA